jgi:hypothetical protein
MAASEDREPMHHLSDPRPVTEVQFGAVADRGTQTGDGSVIYANKRAEMWGVTGESFSYEKTVNTA